MTSNLGPRVEHKEGVVDGFTKNCGTGTLVWYEQHDDADGAITREKRIKKWARAWKVELIGTMNRHRNDLASTLTA